MGENVAGEPEGLLGRLGVPDLTALERAWSERPLWRGRLHQIAFFLTLPAGLFLLVEARSAAARVAVAVYVASLAGLFGASASYHRLARSPAAIKWLRRLDHSMIFVLIAGTYTPICLLVLPKVWGIPLLVTVWVTALAGVIMKMVRVGTHGGKSGSWLYVVMGWAAVLMLPQLLTHLDPVRIALLGAGGLLYTLGAVILASQRPNPSPRHFGYHEVWHAFTVAAGVCHFVMISLVVR